jgi:hypothetical protein
MQPVKNGRTDMPPGVALLEGPGGSSAGASDGQLQARPPLGTSELACTCPVHAGSLRVCTRLTFCGVAAQALQEAGYLAQMQDAQASGGLSGMATGLGVAGEMMPPPGMPGDLSGIANLSNPDAGPK